MLKKKEKVMYRLASEVLWDKKGPVLYLLGSLVGRGLGSLRAFDFGRCRNPTTRFYNFTYYKGLKELKILDQKKKKTYNMVKKNNVSLCNIINSRMSVSFLTHHAVLTRIIYFNKGQDDVTRRVKSDIFATKSFERITKTDGPRDNFLVSL